MHGPITASTRETFRTVSNGRRSSIAEAELRKECEVLQLKLLKANSALALKTQYASRLEYLLHQRTETIDELNGKLEQSREHPPLMFNVDPCRGQWKRKPR